MSKTLNEAQHRAWNLSTSLMVCVVLLQVDGGYSIMPSDEFDGDVESVIREYDPFEI